MKMQIYSVLLAFLISSATGSSEICWEKTNCNPDGADGAVQGQVTDELCGGHYSVCLPLDQNSCSRSAVCVWKSNKCRLNRDRKGNVCLPVKFKVNPVCDALTQGICPLQWQVKRGCCPGYNAKYMGKLEASLGPDYICCNTPCESLQETVGRNQNCSWTDHKHNQQCLPGAKMNGYMNSMVGTTTLDSLATAFGISASGGYFKTGTILQGIPGPYQSMNAMATTNSEKMYVDELTVDDLLLLLCEALEQSDRNNVLTYEAQMTSDPWFGKNVFGGVQDNLRFMNPQKLIDTIYSPMNPAIAGSFIKYPTYNGLGTMGLPPLPSMNTYPGGGGYASDGYGLAMAGAGLPQFAGSGFGMYHGLNAGAYGSGVGIGGDVGSYGRVGSNMLGQGLSYSESAAGYGSTVPVAAGLTGGYGQPVTAPTPTAGQSYGQRGGYGAAMASGGNVAQTMMGTNYGQGGVGIASSGYAGYPAPEVNIGSTYSGYDSTAFWGQPVMAPMPYLPTANQWQSQMAGGGLPFQYGYNMRYGQFPVGAGPGYGQSAVGSRQYNPKKPEVNAEGQYGIDQKNPQAQNFPIGKPETPESGSPRDRSP